MKFAGSGVVADVEIGFPHPLDDDGTGNAGIVGNLAQGGFEGFGHDFSAELFFVVEGGFRLFGDFGEVNQSGAAAGDDAFFYGCFGGVEGVFNPQFAIFEFGFGGGSDFDHGDAAGEFGNPLLQLFFVVVGIASFEFFAQLGDALLHVAFIAIARFGDDGGIFFGDGDFAGNSQHVQRHVFQAEPDFFGDHLPAGEDGDVLEHGFAAIAKSGCLNRARIEHAPGFIHHQRSQGFAFYVFGDYQQGLAGAGDFFQHWHQVLNDVDFLVGYQDADVFVFSQHPLLIGDEVGRDVAAIDLHPLDDIEFGCQGFRFFNGDYPVGGDFFHRFGNHFADFFVVTGGDGGDLLDRGSFNWLGHRFDFFNQLGDGFVDAAPHGYGIRPGCDVPQAFPYHCLRQDCGGGGAVAGDVFRLLRDFPQQAGTGVFQGVF